MPRRRVSWLRSTSGNKPWLACAWAAAFVAACDSGGTATQILVVVDSDLAGGSELTRVDVSLFEPNGSGDVLATRSFAVSAPGSAEKRVYSLPLSFTLAPTAGGGTRAFRLLVSGSGTIAGRTGKLVETQLTSAFQPQKALRLDVFLASECVGAMCSVDANGVALSTCVDENGCVPIPDRTDLPALEGGGLGGYDGPTLPVGDGGLGADASALDGGGDVADSGDSIDATQSDAGALDDGGLGDGAVLSDGGTDAEVDASCPTTGCVCAAGSVSNGTSCVDIEECSDPSNVMYCASTGYPCEESAAPGFTCRGQRADWRMPDSVAGAATRPSYTATGSGDTGLVTDNVTGLQWQARNAREKANSNTTVYSFDQARAYCDALVIGARSDFRIPTMIELASILDTARSVGGTAVLLADGAFSGGIGYYWSSTPDLVSPTLHRLVSFQDGSVPLMSTAMPTTALLRCVSSPTPVASGTPQTRFTPLMVAGAKDAVGQRDLRTGLTWALAVPSAPFQFASATSYCTALGQSVGIVTRVPTYKELLTLLDMPGTAPYTDAPFAASSIGAFWSASMPFGDSSRGYLVNFSAGTGTIDALTNTALVRCVTSSAP